MTHDGSATDMAAGRGWLAELAYQWADAVRAHTFVPMSRGEAERLLGGLAERLAGMLTTESFDREAARRVGATLVEAHVTEPAALEATLALLCHTLPGLGGEPVPMTQQGERLAAVLAALAAGYAQALRERTLAEQERLGKAIIKAYAQLERESREGEARFRAIFAGAAIGIGIADIDGRIVQVNQAFADLLGYTVEEMCQRNVMDLVHPQDEPGMWDRYEDLIRGDIDYVRLEKAYARKNGAVVWTDLTVSLIRDEAGHPRYTVAMLDDITDRHRLQQRLRYQASHDPLTLLPNRTLFADRLTQALASKVPSARVGVCFLDLDGFKHINDSLGHDVGDQLLIQVARRIDECATARGHLAARMGGDEFVVLVERSTGSDEAVQMARDALVALDEPLPVGRHRLRVSASVGVVERSVVGTTPAEIMKAADVSLYWAKSGGRGRWALYDPDRVAAEAARFELSAALPLALDRGEFTLVYQPIVDLAETRVCGVEALVRWRHSRLGLLTPDRFIGLAEETGLIVPLGRFVLQQACEQAVAWQRRFNGNGPFVSVNLAAAQTQEPSLVEDVQGALAGAGLDPSMLQLELTESAAMATAGAPLQALRQLVASGVRVAIDDFGTGYSNLAYLSTLPVHVLKLAGPFIARLREPGLPGGIDERIVDALIRLAHALGLTVTAEGVETPGQANRLRALGCDAVQGFYFARPQEPDQIDDLISAG
jgi:diguanylate cyclase (GGDEF)-like protein/PAS domain S-box-containing protein